MDTAPTTRQVDLGYISSPGELKSAADALDAELTNIDNAVDGNEEIPQALWDGFQSFRSRWKTFYSDNFDSPVWSWLTAKTGSLSDQINGFTADAQSFVEQLQPYGVSVPGALLTPEKPFSLDSLTKPLQGLGISFDVALLAILAIVVAWKVLD